jgi:hypothetical protein
MKSILIIAASLGTIGALGWATTEVISRHSSPTDGIAYLTESERPQKVPNEQDMVAEPEKIANKGVQTPSSLNIRFLNALTGVAVIPELVEITKREDKAVQIRIPKEDLSKVVTLSIPLDNGTYDVVVTALGYVTMASYFQLQDKAQKVNFHLEPMAPVLELSTEYIQSFHRNDGMFLTGFIVDDATGRPIKEVEVYSLDKTAKSISSASGLFQIQIQLPSALNEVEKKNTLVFSASGYATEVRENYDMWPNGDAILQIRMKKGEGENREKIILRREAAISFQ